MARIKGGLNAKKKHNRVLKLAKGYRGARSKQYRVAKQSVMRALTSSYGKLMHGLKLAGVEVNRKMLSEMAISDAAAFTALCETAKAKLA